MRRPLGWVLLGTACTLTTPDPTPATAPPAPSDLPVEARQPGEPPDGIRCTGLPPDPGCAAPVDGGTVTLGAQATDAAAPGHDPDAATSEQGGVPVTVGPLWVQVTEFPALMWSGCATGGGCDSAQVTRGGFGTLEAENKGSHPLNGITWEGARQACAFYGGRLPTEAEWEHLARGAEGRRYPWGDDAQCWSRGVQDAPDVGARSADVNLACGAVLERLTSALGSGPVEQLGELAAGAPVEVVVALCREVGDRDPAAAQRFLQEGLTAAGGRAMDDGTCGGEGTWEATRTRVGVPTARVGEERVGLHGLAGNVAEWTADPWRPRHDAPPDPARRVVKGGGWMDDDPGAWRGAARVGLTPDQQLPDVGFRCVWERRTP